MIRTCDVEKKNGKYGQKHKLSWGKKVKKKCKFHVFCVHPRKDGLRKRSKPADFGKKRNYPGVSERKKNAQKNVFFVIFVFTETM